MHKSIFLFKACLSLLIIYILGKDLDVSQLLSSLKQINLIFFVVAIIFAIFAVPIVANRWRLIANLFNFKIPFQEATGATFVGLFIGQIFPGGIGVDVVRGWMVWNLTSRQRRIIASLATDRIFSLVAISIFIFVSLPFLLSFLPEAINHWIYWGLIFLIFLLLIGYIFSIKILNTKMGMKFKHYVNQIPFSFFDIKHSILKIMSLSILGHFIMILSAFFMSLALGINTLFWMWLLVMPVVILASALPISINGWGVRELTMVNLWWIFGVSESDAFLISIFLGIISILSSLPGIWFWVTKKRQGSLNKIKKNYTAS